MLVFSNRRVAITSDPVLGLCVCVGRDGRTCWEPLSQLTPGALKVVWNRLRDSDFPWWEDFWVAFYRSADRLASGKVGVA